MSDVGSAFKKLELKSAFAPENQRHVLICS